MQILDAWNLKVRDPPDPRAVDILVGGDVCGRENTETSERAATKTNDRRIALSFRLTQVSHPMSPRPEESQCTGQRQRQVSGGWKLGLNLDLMRVLL